MKYLIVFSLLLLTACGKGGGSTPTGGAGHAVDSTPHDYGLTFVVLTNENNAHDAHVHQVCNFNYAGTRDEATDISIQALGEHGGVGCASARDFTVDATNTGIYDLTVYVTVDGVEDMSTEHVMAPGETYNFQRGF